MSRDDIVLVVEDDADVADILELVLEAAGLHVATAQHGEEALEWLRRGHRPRVILLDLMMPVMDGWTLRAELLRNPAWAEIPVLVLTGAGPAAAPAPANIAGLLRKPVDLATLIPAIRRYLS